MISQDKLEVNSRQLPANIRRALLAILVVITFAAYGNSLQGDFVWDDTFLVRDNLDLKNLASLPRVLARPFQLDEYHSTPFYRPLTMVSFFLDYRLWGKNPLGYHLTNLLLHLLAALLFYRLGKRLLPEIAAMAAAFVFALHPIHTESVTFISGRTDILCAVFYLAAILLHLASKRPVLCRVLAVASFTAALLAKEMAVTLPLMLLLIDWWILREKISPRLLGRYLPHAVVVGAYFVLRKAAFDGAMLDLPTQDALILAIKVAPLLIMKYLWVFLWPWTLNSYYILDTSQASTGYLVVGAWFGTLGVITALVICRLRTITPAISYPVLWFLVTLLPVLNFVHKGNVPMAERFAYIPSMGLAWALGLLIAKGLADHGRALKNITAALLAGLVVFYGVRTHARNIDWKDDYALYSSMVQTSPRSDVAHFNLGCIYRDRRDYEAAHRHWREAVTINQRHAGAHNNLGALYHMSDQLDLALVAYFRALEIKPDHPFTWFNIGKIYEARGQHAEAARYYEQYRKLGGGQNGQ